MKFISLPAFLGAWACLGLLGCAMGPSPSRTATQVELRSRITPSAAQFDPVLRQQILALDPEKISEQEIALVLSRAPAPRVVNIHGGVYPVRLYMENFAKFLMTMGYPAERIVLPGGKHSYSCYMESTKIAGAIAYFHEQTGMPVMIVGHSQGGVQALKALHDLAGSSGGGLRVWNPVTEDFENRTVIRDPRNGRWAPIKGLRPVIYVNSVAAGGATLAMPNQWDMIGRTREVPDSTHFFSGYFIPGDVWGGGLSGPHGSNRYRATGKARVRNVLVTRGSKHGTVPVTWHLARNKKSRQFINSFHPAHGDDLPATYTGPWRNLLWAANTWYEIKKCWCLSIQELLRRES